MVEAPPWEPPTSLSWGPCVTPELREVEGVECATLAVRLRPDLVGDVVQLGLTRARATDEAMRVGVLVVHPGGPGIPSGPFVPVVRDALPDVARRFDLVSIDWRGTGASAPLLDCVDDATQDAARAIDSREELEAFLDQLLTGCLGAVGEEMLAHVDTRAAVQDLEWTRQALGEEVLNFFGTSYGTRLGAAYAGAFPDRVRAFVLDAPVTPALDPRELMVGQTEATQRALEELFATCGSAATCPFHGGEGAVGVAAAFEALLDGFPTEGIAVGARQVYVGDVLNVARGLFAVGQPQALAGILAALETGDGSSLLATLDALRGRRADGSSPFAPGANAAVLCADHFHDGGLSTTALDAVDAELREISPRFGGAGPFFVCPRWTRSALPPLPVTASDAPPLLVVQGLHDPSTPPGWADALLATLGNGSFLFASDHTGHGGLRSARAGRRIRDFLLDPSRAPDELSCQRTLTRPTTVDVASLTFSYAVTADPPPATPTDATVQVLRLSDGEVLAEGVAVIGGEAVVLTVPTDGAPLQLAVRASAPGYRTRVYVTTSPQVRDGQLPITLLTDARLAASLGSFDPALANVMLRGVNCDSVLHAGTFALSPSSGQLLHALATDGSCFLERGASRTDGCGASMAINVAEGTYDLTFAPEGRDALSIALEGLPIEAETFYSVAFMP